MQSKRFSARVLAPLSLWAALLVGCDSAPAPRASAPLPQCDAALAAVPKVFELPLLESLSGPQLDAARLAHAECLDATATRNLDTLAARELATGRKVADYATAGFFARRRTLREAQASNAALERDWLGLAAARAELSATIDTLYATPVQSSTRGLDLQHLTALALFDFARLTREHYGKHAHTAVSRLSDVKFCAGDLIADRLLWRYFESAVRARREGTSAEAQAVAALRGIAIQSSCLGERQLAEYDQALSDAARELAARLAAARLDAVADAAIPFIAQARLLILDADKHLGADSPGFLWWLQQDSLRRRLRDAAVRPLEQVLWLYDRRSAALAALKTHCKRGSLGQQCINLSVFVDSLTRPSAYGFGECSFLEMIEGGVRSVGGAPTYTCTPGVCGTPTSAGRMPMTPLAQSFGTAFGRSPGYQLPNKTARTPFGVDMPTARKDLCGNGGGFGGRDGAAGDGGPGMGPGGDKLACVMGERAARTAALVPGMACIARYVAATSPLRPPNEIMRETAYAGIPRGCAVGEDNAGDGGNVASDPMNPMSGMDGGTDKDKKSKEDLQKQAKDLAEELKKNPAKLDELKKAIKDATGVDVTDKQITEALNNLANANVTSDPLIVDGQIANGATDIGGQITLYLGTMNSRSDADNRATMLHELVHSVVNIASDARRSAWTDIWGTLNLKNRENLAKDYRKGVEDQDAGIRKHWSVTGGSSKRCVADDPDCNNRCNGMNRQTQQALACLNNALNPQTIPPTPDDLVTDPIEPGSANNNALGQCFDDGLDVGGVVTARQCSAVHCANSAYGLKGGQCCQPQGGLDTAGIGVQQREICTVVRCEASVGQMASGAAMGDLSQCGCGGGVGAPSGTPPPTLPGEGPFPPPHR